MGFFDFFKRPEPEKEKIDLSLDEVPKYLEAQEKEAKESALSEIKNIKTKLEEEKSKLLENLSVLERAELQNQKIPDRAKQIMEGNRQIYIQKIQNLHEQIYLPEEPQEIKQFTEDFDKTLGDFEQGIGKSHRIMEEFFLDKASVISTNIKKIDKLVKDAQAALKNSGLENIEKTKDKFSELKNKQKKLEENKKSLFEIKENISNLSNELKEKESLLVNLQKSKEYQEAHSLIEEKNQTKKQIEDINSRTNHYFSELGTAIKKYENLSSNKLAKQYLSTPLNTLEEDKNLEILNLLGAIKSAVQNNEIKLKDKKREKTLATIELLTNEFLENFLKSKHELIEKLSALNGKIEENPSLKKAEELQRKISDLEEVYKKRNNQLKNTERELSGINIRESTEELEITMQTNLKAEISIR